MPTYLAFGLRIAAERSLPGLVPFDGEGVDVYVALAPTSSDHGYEPPGIPDCRVIREDGGVISVQYSDGVAFTIRSDGGAVAGRWSPPQTVDDAICYLVGPILRTVLRLRGVPTLHGSAVALDGNAIAVVGPSGAGKSTLAAALVKAGGVLVTDDTVTLARSGHEFRILPGYCGLRLWPDVAPTVCAHEQLDPITPTWNKRFLRVTGRQFRREASALRGVYVLSGRKRLETHLVEPLDGPAAFIALAANMGVTYVDGRDLRAENFVTLADLVERVPVRCVTPVDDLSGAASLAELILEDARRLPAGD